MTMRSFGRAFLLTFPVLLLAGCNKSSSSGGTVPPPPPPPPEIRFSMASYAGIEASGPVTITVERVVNAAGAVSVSFATGGGTATASVDYTPASGSLAWVDQDMTPKTFDVVIIDDPTVEGDEWVDLTLTGPTGGAILGSPSAARLTIQDDDTGMSGVLDTGFGNGGVVSSDPSPGTDIPNAVAVDVTHIYVAGYDQGSPTNGTQWRVEKLQLADGAPDNGFGTLGAITSDPSPADDRINGMAIDGTYIYLAGFDKFPGASDPQWRIEKRNLSDGMLDINFGTLGAVTFNPSVNVGAGAVEVATAIAIDSTWLYVVGNDESPGMLDWQWRIDKLSLADGSRDTSFGNNGTRLSNPSGMDDLAQAIAIDSTAMYVAGGDAFPGNGQWRIEKRNLSNGALVLGFGSGGAQTVDLSSGYDRAEAIWVDGASIFVAGYEDDGAGDARWRIEKRDSTTGNLDLTFGSGGAEWNDLSLGFDSPDGIAVDATSIYLAGYLATPSFADPAWVIEKRDRMTGSLDPGFGSAGIVIVDPTTGSEFATDITIDSTFIYVVGYVADPVAGDLEWRIEKRFR
ncbi:MAG: hypothetical protein O7H41_06150 [Planctomycetota bacterium]|nr:hypothetical protein [Planctomycetota bacterium]